jgi:hypothetical protein
MRRASAFVLLPVLLLLGCAGDGSELGGMMNGEIEPTLASIQANVFTPICTECHFPGGPGPMPLTSEDVSFQNLVNVQSIEIASLLRVQPGDAENSYLVHKIEGRGSINGTRMPPPPRAMLTVEEIDAIIEWIDMGAPQ